MGRKNMISNKQKKILAFPYSRYDAIICDGAVRSGKTSIIMWAFVEWAMREFNGQRFGICGKELLRKIKSLGRKRRRARVKNEDRDY